jgi:hypothetical protein
VSPRWLLSFDAAHRRIYSAGCGAPERQRDVIAGLLVTADLGLLAFAISTH